MYMDKDRKIRIIEDFFENKFNMDNFKEFVTNILNIKIDTYELTNNIKRDKNYKEYIENCEIIADYEDSDRNDILILAINIKNEIDPVRARVKQREFVAKQIRDRNKKAALAVFYNENNHFRISLIKLDLEFTAKGIKEKLTPAKRLSYVVGEGEACKTPKDQFGNLKNLEDSVTLEDLENVFALEKVTNEFFNEYKKKYLKIRDLLVEDKEFMKEAKKHEIEKPEKFVEGFTKKLLGQIVFLYFLQKKGWLGIDVIPPKLTSKEFDEIQTLSKEKVILNKFFNKTSEDIYELDFEKMKEITDNKERDSLVRAFKNTKYFGEWGTGDKKFIRSLFNKHKEKEAGTDKTFFDDYLEVLFYNNLSKDRGELQYSTDFNTRIPFLNGGLFDPYGEYDWKNTSFNLDDEIFSNEKEDGILDVFDRYNFTINENDSYETEVAVDPEMLGKVFENLLNVSDRKSTGSFYTPREIVRYMTNESLSNYLLANLEDTGITKDDMEYIFNLGEFTKEYDSVLYETDYLEKKNNITKLWGMPECVRKNIKRIDELLKNVRIADPACGSGAFPLGILNEIVRAREVLTFYINILNVRENNEENKYFEKKAEIEKIRKPYELKIQAIKDCIHGVDIEPSAIDITKLRLWLSIVVDADNSDVKPLPNLDFNFEIGNSLVDEFEGIKLFDESLLENNKNQGKTKMGYQRSLLGIKKVQEEAMDEIIYKQEKFFNECNSQKKLELKEEIQDLQLNMIEITLRGNGNNKKLEEIIKGRKERRKPYFLWKLEFVKVFKENGGFDIIIGNPPYVGEKGNKEIFHSIRNSGLQKFYIQKVDLFYFFFHLGLDLLKEKGKLAFITTNYYLTADGALKLREDLKNRSHLEKLINFNEITIFETAKGQHNLITILEKNTGPKENEITKTIVCSNKVTLKDIDEVLYLKSDKAKYYTIPYEKLYESDKFYIRLESDKIVDILDKIKKNKNLKEFCNINQGLRTGADKLTNSHINKYSIVEEKGKGIFVLKKEEYMELLPKLNEFEKSCYKPLFKNSDISKYIVSEKVNYYFLDLACPRDKNIPKESIPNIIEYLKPFKSILENRKETANGVINAIEEGIWWLISVRRKLDFSLEKLVVPQRSKTNVFGYNNTEWNSSADVYFITKKTNELDLKYILAILNSKLCYAWLYKKGKRKGEMLELYATPLEQIPIKVIPKEEQQKYIDIVDRIIELKKQDKDTEELERRVDQMVYKLYDLTDEEIKIIEENV